MTVLEIMTAYLKENGYSGLYNEDAECGCQIDDLAPCGGIDMWQCSPGMRYRDDEGWKVGSRAYVESLREGDEAAD